jgi:hypothetical protein
MARWIALGFTLLCFVSCSFMSQNPIRGVAAPLGFAIGSFVTLYLFIRERVSSVARSGNEVYLSEMAKRAAAAKRVEALKAKLAEQTGNPSQQEPKA